MREPTGIGKPVEKRRISIGKGLCREAVEAPVLWGLIDEWRRPHRFGARKKALKAPMVWCQLRSAEGSCVLCPLYSVDSVEATAVSGLIREKIEAPLAWRQ